MHDVYVPRSRHTDVQRLRRLLAGLGVNGSAGVPDACPKVAGLPTLPAAPLTPGRKKRR